MPIICKWFGKHVCYHILSWIISQVYLCEVMLYINIFGARMVCRILSKYYASLIVTHDGSQSFLHIFNICQSLLKPNRFFSTMTSSHVFHFFVDKTMVGCFLHFHKIIPTPTKNTILLVDCQTLPLPAIRITKTSQDNVLPSKA